MVPIWLGSIISFVYGTVVGSFLNVCIYRIPAEQSIVTPPSHCPKCNNRLKALDLVPLFSFLFLGRKCRYCGTPISWRYFSVELLTGLLFLATYLRCQGFTIDFFVFVLFISAMLVAFFVDIDQMIIPDQVVFFGLILGLGRDIAHLIAGENWLLHIPTAAGTSLPMLPSIAGMVICAGIFYLIAYVGYFLFKPKDLENEEEYGGALGGGDINLAAAIGAVLGAKLATISFFLAVVLGAVIGIVILALRSRAEKKGIPWRTEIPFGPYMVTGAIMVMLLLPQLNQLWEAWSRLVTRG